MDHFEKYNAIRIHRTKALMSRKGKMIFDIIPYLLQVNIPGVPGYIESSHQFGISRYKLTRKIVKMLQTVFPYKLK